MWTKALSLAAIAVCLSGCASDELSVVLTPTTPEIATVLVEADARWEAAGVAPDRIVIGLHGAPVRVADLGSVEAGTVMGRTVVRKRQDSPSIRVRSMDLAGLTLPEVMHEMGHALGAAVGFNAHPGEHAEGEFPGACAEGVMPRPIMCAVGAGALITETDLTMVCEAGACMHFTPEG